MSRAASSTRPTTSPEAAHFRPHLGDNFRVEATPHALRLIDVSEQPVHGGLEQFSLVFSGAGELDDRIYTLVHPALGRQDLFLARIGPHAAGHCEACFSRHAGGRTRA